MKRGILSVFLTLSVISFAFSQTGNWFVGGSTGYSRSTQNVTGASKIALNRWDISPEIGVNILPSVQLAGALNFSHMNNDQVGFKGEAFAKRNALAPVVYCRKFWPVADHFSVFTGVFLNWLAGKSEDFAGLEYRDRGLGAQLKVGAAYAIGPRFTLIGEYGAFGYTSTWSTELISDTRVSNNDFGLGVNTLGPVFDIGIYYTFIVKDDHKIIPPKEGGKWEDDGKTIPDK